MANAVRRYKGTRGGDSAPAVAGQTRRYALDSEAVSSRPTVAAIYDRRVFGSQ